MTTATEDFAGDQPPGEQPTGEQPTGEQRGDSRAIAWIVMILLLLSLAAGGWLSWKKWFAGPTESGPLDVGTISDRFRPRVALQPRPAPELAKDGVHPIGGNMFRVTSGEYFMTLAPVETTYAPLRLFVTRADLLPPDARVLIRMVRDPGLAAAASGLGMSPDQVKQLTAFRTQLQGGISIAPADRDQLASQWKSWNAAKDAAGKSAIEKTLLASMKDIGARNLEATRKQYSDIAAQIRKIVTDQQIAQYRQLRGN